MTNSRALAAGSLLGRAKQIGRHTFVVKVPLEKRHPVTIPVHVVRGRKSGPTLVAAAGEHGVEVNGVAAVDRIFREIDPGTLAGTFVGIPAVNPPNILRRGFSAGAYGGRWDSFGTWPGDAKGTPAERIAAALTKAVIDEADVVINIHAWSWYSASCAFTSSRNAQAMRLARAFGLELVSFGYAGYCKGVETKPHPRRNMLTHYVLAQGKPAMLVELRTQHWLYPPSVAAGMTGIRNVMQTLGMLPGQPRPPGRQYAILGEEVVRARRAGLFVPLKAMGEKVRKNESLGYLLDLKTGRPTDVKSPCVGVIWLVSRVGPSDGVCLSDMHAHADPGDMLAMIKHVR
jgi:uncharacterized protein